MSKKFLVAQALNDIKGQESILYFENIIDGFNNFGYISLKFEDYKGYAGFINHVLTGSLFKNISASYSDYINYSTYFDFYYHLLESDEQQNFNRLINEHGIGCLLGEFDFNSNSNSNKNKNNIFFEFDYRTTLHHSVVDFITKISFNQILFSTFYLVDENSNLSLTLWTDYNGCVHVFFKNKDLLYNNVVELSEVYAFKII